MKKIVVTNTIFAIINLVLVILCVYFAYQYIYKISAKTVWVHDIGYKENQVHRLKFDEDGLPLIPVNLGEKHVYLNLNTGCDSGLVLTNEVEKKIPYTEISKTEELNRDGSHRGWSKEIQLDKLTVFHNSFKEVKASLIDWKMNSSFKYNGSIGLEYFNNKVITLDYRAKKIGVTNKVIDYSKLDSNKYIVIPLLKSNQEGQENLVYFKGIYDGKPIMISLDTGKNISFVHNDNSTYNPGVGKPSSKKSNITLQLNDSIIKLKKMNEANLEKVSDLEYPVVVELNSDQIHKKDFIVTFDLIDQKIILSHRK